MLFIRPAPRGAGHPDATLPVEHSWNVLLRFGPEPPDPGHLNACVLSTVTVSSKEYGVSLDGHKALRLLQIRPINMVEVCGIEYS